MDNILAEKNSDVIVFAAYSRAAAISSDRLQLSLIPFAHSRRTVAFRPLQRKTPYGTARKYSDILHFGVG